MPKKQQATKYEVQRRIGIVAQWMLDGVKQSDIIYHVGTSWQVSSHQALNYIRVAREQILKSYLPDLGESVAFHLQRREILYRELMKGIEEKRDPVTKEIIEGPSRFERAALVRTALSVDQDSAKLKGLYIEQHAHNVTQGPIDISKFTEQQLYEIVHGRSNGHGREEVEYDAEFEDIAANTRPSNNGNGSGPPPSELPPLLPSGLADT